MLPCLVSVVRKQILPCSVHGRQRRQEVVVRQTGDATPRQSIELRNKRVVHELSLGRMRRFDVLEDPGRKAIRKGLQKRPSRSQLVFGHPPIQPSDPDQRFESSPKWLVQRHGHVCVQ